MKNCHAQSKNKQYNYLIRCFE